MSNKPDEDYWTSYTAIQKAKHDLLKRYLQAWFPILSRWRGRVLYFDCHAGKGRHETGELGSPLIALRTLLEHNCRDQILRRCEVRFFFMELNPAHVQNLKSELAGFGELPKNVTAEVIGGDYETVIRKTLDNLKMHGLSMAPSFFFVDPYGFLLPMDLMRGILSHPRTELLVTFMVRYIFMAIPNEDQEDNMDMVFGTTDWRALRQIAEPSKRYSEMIKLYTSSLGCKHCSVLEMRGPHSERKYSLVHATNHPLGREKMKDATWKVSGGTYVIYQSDNPNQLALIGPDPDLTPLEGALAAEFSGRKLAYNKLKRWLLDQVWLPKHLNKALRNLRDQGRIRFPGIKGKRIAFSKNPVVVFGADKDITK